MTAGNIRFNKSYKYKLWIPKAKYMSMTGTWGIFPFISWGVFHPEYATIAIL